MYFGVNVSVAPSGLQGWRALAGRAEIANTESMRTGANDRMGFWAQNKVLFQVVLPSQLLRVFSHKLQRCTARVPWCLGQGETSSSLSNLQLSLAVTCCDDAFKPGAIARICLRFPRQFTTEVSVRLRFENKKSLTATRLGKLQTH